MYQLLSKENADKKVNIKIKEGGNSIKTPSCDYSNITVENIYPKVVQMQKWDVGDVSKYIEDNWAAISTLISNIMLNKSIAKKDKQKRLAGELQQHAMAFINSRIGIEDAKIALPVGSHMSKKKAAEWIENEKQKIRRIFNTKDLDTDAFLRVAEFICSDWSGYISQRNNLSNCDHPIVPEAIHIDSSYSFNMPPAIKSQFDSAGLTGIDIVNVLNVKKCGNQLSAHLFYTGGQLYHNTHSKAEKTYFYEVFPWKGERMYFLIAYGFHTDEVQEGRKDSEHKYSYKLQWVCKELGSFKVNAVLTL